MHLFFDTIELGSNLFQFLILYLIQVFQFLIEYVQVPSLEKIYEDHDGVLSCLDSKRVPFVMHYFLVKMNFQLDELDELEIEIEFFR